MKKNCASSWLFTKKSSLLFKNSTVLNSPCMMARFSELPCCKYTVRTESMALVSSHVLRSRVNCTGMWRRVCQFRRFEGPHLRNVGQYMPRDISLGSICQGTYRRAVYAKGHIVYPRQHAASATPLWKPHTSHFTLHASARSVEIWLLVGLDRQSWSGSKAPNNG